MFRPHPPNPVIPVSQIVLIGLSILLFCPILSAQVPCLAEARAKQNLQRYPGLAALRQQVQNQIAAYKPGTQGRTVVSIPVVVHVVYKGNLENISEDQINSQLAVLNADFRRLNADTSETPGFFLPVAADMEINFCLAGRDPTGNPSNGITRTGTPWSNIGQLNAPDGRPRIHYTALGGQDAWPPEQYLNIWVCNIGSGILGFGTYPGTAPPLEDGLVIDPRYFGTTGLAAFYPPHHLGRTATHEVGHYFDLYHIWGADEFSCADDDDVEDTPQQRGPYLGCPAYPQFSCGNSAMFMNFMDYTNDACMSIFTLGQKDRLWATLNTVRSGLLDSLVCGMAPTNTIQTTKTALAIYPNPAKEELIIDDPDRTFKTELVRVVDSNGRIWLEEKRRPDLALTRLDIAVLPAGSYSVFLLSKTAVKSALFVKMP